MICATCKGKPYRVLVFVLDHQGNPSPVAMAEAACPDCGGCGHGHCCDGLQEQPEGTNDGTTGP